VKRVGKLIIASLLSVVLVLLTGSAIASAIADPDTQPSVLAVYVYENCYEDGDVGVLVDYYLDYSTLPDETAAEAYLVSFVDTDGSTILASVAPYVYQTSGYGRGLVWLRFTAAEVASYGLTSDNQSDYEIWLHGNPTVESGWAGDPPKTIATIDQWSTAGDPSSVIALRVLYYADVLEVLWSLDLIQETYGGTSTLTTLGESYFINVITHLRAIAPAVFASVETSPDYHPVSYDTAFGATASNGTATITGSPVTLNEGVNSITTTTTGTIYIQLSQWASGNITNGTGVVTGSPADLTPGVNTMTVTGAGNFTIELEAVDAVTLKDAQVGGTALDLTDLGTSFGMSRWMISGIIWMLITILVCAAAFRVGSNEENARSGGNAVVFVFAIMLMGGWWLGLVHPLVMSLFFIAIGGYIGYILFFRSESLHKGFMFMLWMFLIVSMAGNLVASGLTGITSTYLTADVSPTETSTIHVASTEGFPDSGFIVIGDEYIGYPSKTDTTFTSTKTLGITTNPLLRGADGTSDNTTHTAGAGVRTREASIFNSAIDYKIASIADTAGIQGFITFPARLLSLILTVFTLPLSFLGTDLAILSYIWMVVAVGMLVGFILTMAGGRRV